MSRRGENYGDLNIHYKRYILLDPDETQIEFEPEDRALLEAEATERENDQSAILLRKAFTRRRIIYQRHEVCKRALSAKITQRQPPRPHITACNLETLSLLALPLELRRQIYDLHYQSYAVKILDLNYDGTYFLWTNFPASRESPPGRDSPKMLWNYLLALPLTCRTIYPEAIVYLYSKTTFRFTDPRLAIRIPETIPLKHLQSLRSLEFVFFHHLVIDYFEQFGVPTIEPDSKAIKPRLSKAHDHVDWPKLLSALAALPKLNHIRLKIHPAPCLPEMAMHSNMSQYILEPLLRLKETHVVKVDLDLCWRPEDRLFDSLGLRFKTTIFGLVQKPRFVTEGAR